MGTCEDEPPYVVKYSVEFAKQWKNLTLELKGLIKRVIDTFMDHGLLNQFEQYEGKISHSWRNCANDEDREYAQENNMWHIHIGCPYFEKGFKYSTSDWVLHFVWDKYNNPNTMILIDCYTHQTSENKFYLPDKKYLVMPN